MLGFVTSYLYGFDMCSGMRIRDTCYRAIHPKWSSEPLSGMGAAIHGGRYTPKGTPTLHLSLDVNTALSEALGRGQFVDNSDCSVISTGGVPLVRERSAVLGQYAAASLQQYQRLSGYSPLMCH